MKKLSVFLVCMSLSGSGLHPAEQESFHDRPYSQLETDILNATTLEALQALSTQAEFSDALDQLVQRGESPLILAITNGNLEAVKFFSSCCRGRLKNEGVPTPFQLALKLSSMNKDEGTFLYPKSSHRKAILDTFIDDSEVMVQPIIRSCWGISEEGDERYDLAMECFMDNIHIIQRKRKYRWRRVKRAIRQNAENYFAQVTDGSDGTIINTIVDFACLKDEMDFSDCVAPQRNWFSSGQVGREVYNKDLRRYNQLQSGTYYFFRY